LLLLPTFVCVLGACASDPGTSADPSPVEPQIGASGGASGVQQRNVAGSRNGAGGRDNVKRNPTKEDESADVDGDPGAAGDGPIAEQPPVPEDPIPEDPIPEDPLLESCELDGDGKCVTKCSDTVATCGVISTGFACEFEGFTGATAEVACAQRLVIGTACCGGCGCVPVELFFDGKRCWQGIPKCDFPQFSNKLYSPHPTSEPNPSFIPPVSFYLGSGGIGGSSANAGGGGLETVTGGATASGGSEAIAGTGSASAGHGGTAGVSEAVAGSSAGGIPSGGGAAGSSSGGTEAGASGEAGGTQATAGARTTPEGGGGSAFY